MTDGKYAGSPLFAITRTVRNLACDRYSLE